jgi:hypothetical protein
MARALNQSRQHRNRLLSELDHDWFRKHSLTLLQIQTDPLPE